MRPSILMPRIPCRGIFHHFQASAIAAGMSVLITTIGPPAPHFPQWTWTRGRSSAPGNSISSHWALPQKRQFMFSDMAGFYAPGAMLAGWQRKAAKSVRHFVRHGGALNSAKTLRQGCSSTCARIQSGRSSLSWAPRNRSGSPQVQSSDLCETVECLTNGGRLFRGGLCFPHV